MASILRPDPFLAQLLNSPPLEVTLEQKNYIREILEVSCSDSRFAEKAYLAIERVLTSGIVTSPKVDSLDPSSVELGSPSFDIHVMGSGFTPESVIVFNGYEEPTVFVSDSELTTGVNMSVWLAPAEVPVSVGSVGVQSESVMFTFLAPEAGVEKVTEKIVEKKLKEEKKVELPHKIELPHKVELPTHKSDK
jgi:hypothetical protein